MAKSLRSSVKKGNKARLRSKVFRPVEDARTERLSAKLLELAAKPNPTAALDPTSMDLDGTGASALEARTVLDAYDCYRDGAGNTDERWTDSDAYRRLVATLTYRAACVIPLDCFSRLSAKFSGPLLPMQEAIPKAI